MDAATIVYERLQKRTKRPSIGVAVRPSVQQPQASVVAYTQDLQRQVLQKHLYAASPPINNIINQRSPTRISDASSIADQVSVASTDTLSSSFNGSSVRLLSSASFLSLLPGEPSRQHWKPDSAAVHCALCRLEFTFLLRRHHCRRCGDVFCSSCSNVKQHQSTRLMFFLTICE